jgi:glycosyltransferase involved in cell wall biosynthesis
MSKHKLFIISPFYPPVESIATNRIVSFCRYLKSFDITVITKSENDFIEEEYDAIKVIRIPDRSILKKATFHKKTDFIIHNLKALYNRALLFFQLDEYDGWRKSVLNFIKEKSLNIDILITSFAPISPHIIGIYLKERCPKMIWVADMRDQMSSNIFFPKHYREKIKPYEAEILEKADIITAVSKPIIEEFAKKAVRQDIEFLEVRNGYDFEIKDIDLPKNKIWTVTYTGTFYGSRNPDNFLKVVKKLIIDKRIDDIKINLVGVTKPIPIDPILKEKVKFFNKVSNNDAIDFMRSSDALLLIHPTSELKGIYTGKLFEYIGVLRPIIALVDPEDVAADLIREGDFGFVADNDNIEEISNIIIKAYNIWKGEVKFMPNIGIAKQCHRKFQVEKLEELLLRRLNRR